MSNHFPTAPTLSVSSITYTANIAYVYNGNLTPGTASPFYLQPAVNSLVNFSPGGGGNSGGQFVFPFTTPGSVGTFDQDTVESMISLYMKDSCDVVAYAAGDTVANVEATVNIQRAWTFTDASTRWQLTYTDSMSFP